MNITSLRIKQKREELGLSAEQLGEKIGKAKTTIYRYESGFIDKMPSDILLKIANVLGVTPLYLMGIEESNSTKQENELINLILQLTDEETEELSKFVDYLISKRK
jgi:transcriptional regulator with XRE-family HTH domain